MAGISLQAKNKSRIISAFVFFLAPLISFSNEYDNKSLLCSTKSHLVKGGFIFTNDREVDKFNILMTHDGLKTIKPTYSSQIDDTLKDFFSKWVEVIK